MHRVNLLENNCSCLANVREIRKCIINCNTAKYVNIIIYSRAYFLVLIILSGFHN